MRTLILLSALTAHSVAAPLDGARMDVPFSDIRTLLDERAKIQPAPAIGASVLSARYDVGFTDGFVSGTADFEVQTFRDGEQVVPLCSGKVIIEAVQPGDAVIVRADGNHALVVNGKRRIGVTLRFHVPLETDGAIQSAGFGAAPAAVCSVKAAKVSGAYRFRLAGGCQRGDTWYLSGADAIRMELTADDSSRTPALALPAIVSSAAATMRIVRDGALFNAMRWQVRHRKATDFELEMPADIQFVSFTVGGCPAQPAKIDGRHVTVHLPDPGSREDGTAVEFSYTARKPAIAPMRGELSLELPSTPALVEKSTWQLALPDGFELVSLQGNMQREGPSEPGPLRLRKEITTGETPVVRLAYQNSEVNMPATVSTVTSSMRIVRDGAIYNAMRWQVCHKEAVEFRLEMPPDAGFVTLSVGGRPARPAAVDGRHVEIRLPAAVKGSTGTTVEFSYTARKPAFAPVRGELSLELPSTPLLVEKAEWQLTLPSGFEPVAIDGNVECEPSKDPGVIRLSKEISIGEVPTARLFYQKSETNKK